MTNVSVQKSFERGQYLEAIASAERALDLSAGPARLDHESLTYYLGALAFVGRLEEAELIYQNEGRLLSAALEIRVRFFFVISYCRQSRYREAKALLLQNLLQRRLRVRRGGLEGLDEFFIRQGLAFYRYFQAAYGKALRQATRAERAASQARSDYGLILAQDLCGHVRAQLQDHESALCDLRHSSRRARSLGLYALCATSEISQLIYQAEQGLDPLAPDLLRNAIETFTSDDTYSKSNLRLELARQLFWRGRLQEALGVLDHASRIIHATRNRRQEALLNLRYADTHLFAGRTERALSHLRFAELCLVPPSGSTEQFDLDLALKIAATERRIVRALDESVQLVEAKILELRERTGLPADFDPQDRLMRRLASPEPLARDAGLLSFLVLPGNPSCSERVLVLDLFPACILSAHEGEIRLKKGLAPLLRKTLCALSTGPKTKHDLIEEVWQYRYDPARHDALIYSTFATLRRLLECRSHWVETSESGYALAAGVRLISQMEVNASAEKLPIKTMGRTDRSRELTSQLNYRQIEILKLLTKTTYVTTSICQKAFEVSEITASRDLSHLLRLNLVYRIGKGRAVRYSLDSTTVVRELSRADQNSDAGAKIYEETV